MEDFIRREETAGAIEIVDGKPRKQSRGRIDYTLRIRINPNTQPVALALIEAKAEHLPPMHGLEQGKLYAACKRLNVGFVFSSNGHLFVEFDRLYRFDRGGETDQRVSFAGRAPGTLRASHGIPARHRGPIGRPVARRDARVRPLRRAGRAGLRPPSPYPATPSATSTKAGLEAYPRKPVRLSRPLPVSLPEAAPTSSRTRRSSELPRSSAPAASMP